MDIPDIDVDIDCPEADFGYEMDYTEMEVVLPSDLDHSMEYTEMEVVLPSDLDHNIEYTKFNNDLKYSDYDPIAEADAVWENYDPYELTEILRMDALIDQIEMELAEVVNDPNHFLNLTNQLDSFRR